MEYRESSLKIGVEEIRQLGVCTCGNIPRVRKRVLTVTGSCAMAPPHRRTEPRSGIAVPPCFTEVAGCVYPWRVYVRTAASLICPWGFSVHTPSCSCKRTMARSVPISLRSSSLEPRAGSVTQHCIRRKACPLSQALTTTVAYGPAAGPASFL